MTKNVGVQGGEHCHAEISREFPVSPWQARVQRQKDHKGTAVLGAAGFTCGSLSVCTGGLCFANAQGILQRIRAGSKM